MVGRSDNYKALESKYLNHLVNESIEILKKCSLILETE